MKYFDIDTGLEVQLTEEEEISLASQCSFANRYPIKQDLLDRMSDLSIEGGALYRFKIDPGAIQNELEHAGHEHASIELPEGFSTELDVIRSAVRAGLIARALVPGSDPSSINNDTRILKNSFLAWVKQQELAALAKDAPQAAPTTKLPATSPSGDDWKEQARVIADEFFDNDTKSNCRDSLKGYAKRTMEKMQERKIKGPRGIIDNQATIMREALQGKKWWANKSK